MSRDHRVVHEAVWAPLIVLAFCVARFFPFETLSGVLICPFRAITSFPCMACGGTRAMIAFTRLDFALAFEMNPLVALGACAASIYVLHAFRVLLTRRPWRPALRSGAFRAACVTAIVVNWGYLIAVGR